MPPKTLTRALRDLVDQAASGPLDERVESACDKATATVIGLYGAELGSKSKAIRVLIEKGAAALLAERA